LLQKGLPICQRPFADVAKLLNTDEAEVLQQTQQLKESGIIRRISALINYRAIGKVSTLVTAHIEQESLQEVIEAVNALGNVSHNYLRLHHYNLWFTLQTQSSEEIKGFLSNLSGRFATDFHSLPVRRVFKLDVRFDAEGQDQMLLRDVEQVPVTIAVELNEKQRTILARLQSDLKIVENPFDFLSREGLESKEVLSTIAELIDKGVVRRIAVVVDHRKLGFVANVLFAGAVGHRHVAEAGKKLACFGIVSHCYERETVKDWPCNLFAMMHARSMGEIQHVVNKFVEAEKIDLFELLPTAAELKKQPVKHQF
jgi:DNA-binding Lrp family transcriptional regulator